MISVSYTGKNGYSAGKTSGILRGGASGVNSVVETSEQEGCQLISS